MVKSSEWQNRISTTKACLVMFYLFDATFGGRDSEYSDSVEAELLQVPDAHHDDGRHAGAGRGVPAGRRGNANAHLFLHGSSQSVQGRRL